MSTPRDRSEDHPRLSEGAIAKLTYDLETAYFLRHIYDVRRSNNPHVQMMWEDNERDIQKIIEALTASDAMPDEGCGAAVSEYRELVARDATINANDAPVKDVDGNVIGRVTDAKPSCGGIEVTMETQLTVGPPYTVTVVNNRGDTVTLTGVMSFEVTEA